MRRNEMQTIGRTFRLCQSKKEEEMSKLQMMLRRNKVAQLIRISNRHKNVLRWSDGETAEHILMKLEICKWLKSQGKEFYTEAILINGLRCDVINCDDEVIYEVVESEKEESIQKKRLDYPLPIIVVKAGQKFDERLVL